MKANVWCGTPAHLEHGVTITPAGTKTWLKKKIAIQEKWASRFNLKLQNELAAMRGQVSDINLADIPIGHTRQWQATDDHSGVVFVFGVEVTER